MKDVFILLGSNRGDRKGYIFRALEMIEVDAGAICKKSALYESEPWGFEDQIPFLNQVVEIETILDPEDLLDHLLTIEVKLGRSRSIDGSESGTADILPTDTGSAKKEVQAYAGRTIDLDILFYGQQLLFTEKLVIPHPRLHERRFTLVPLKEIAPEFVHPWLKKTISALLINCPDRSNVTLINSFEF